MGRFFGAIWYYVSFKFLWGSEAIRQAADRTFTSSAAGVAKAYDLEHDKRVKEYKSLRDAVSQVEALLEDSRQRLQDLNKEEEGLLAKRDGALHMFEEAQFKNDANAMQQHRAAFDRFDAQIARIEEQQTSLDQQLNGSEQQMRVHLDRLTALQSEVQALPEEKARAIAEYVSSTKLVELSDRMQGLKSSMDRGPLDAVRQHNRELSAKARISQKLAGADVNVQDSQYTKAGQRSASSDRMAQMLAARQAERTARTGEKPAEPATAERPKI
jgi:phage-related tail protein